MPAKVSKFLNHDYLAENDYISQAGDGGGGTDR